MKAGEAMSWIAKLAADGKIPLEVLGSGIGSSGQDRRQTDGVRRAGRQDVLATYVSYPLAVICKSLS